MVAMATSVFYWPLAMPDQAEGTQPTFKQEPVSLGNFPLTAHWSCQPFL
jgi:hypothetical protein